MDEPIHEGLEVEFVKHATMMMLRCIRGLPI